MFRKKPNPALIPAWMVVGLGNPGPEYRGTRHNVGFEVVDRLAREHHISVSTGKHRALTGIGSVRDVPCLLVKPLTFMNLSGQAVGPLARQCGIPPERILVVADDLDLPLGKLRLRESGGSGGHNGHKSIQAALGTNAYPRLRIGIGRGENGAVDHVLSPFSPEERAELERVLASASRIVEWVVADQWSEALREVERYNLAE